MNGIESAFSGRVTNESIELKTSQSGKAWAAFVAVGTGDDVQWLRVAVFGDRAEELAGQLQKGNQVYVEGRLTLRTWEKDGQTQAGLNVAAWRVERMGEIGRNKPPKRKH